jgi:RimJ/RimL family protein N-acetyltransferase
MIECPINHPALSGLFNPKVPNNPALWAVFHGRHSGQAVVDELDQPSQCVIRTDAVMTYASQNVSQPFLEAALDHFRGIGPIWLIRAQGDPPAPEPVRCLSRLEFYDLDPSSPVLAKFRNEIEMGYTVRTIDRELLERCEWRDDMEFFAGSLENFLQNDLGICLMRAEEIIVEAYASALGAPYAEIGAITHEPYRGKGYATQTVACLIEILAKLGYQCYWSCDIDNPASARVARKLGFRIEKPYEIWEYLPYTDEVAII